MKADKISFQNNPLSLTRFPQYLEALSQIRYNRKKVLHVPDEISKVLKQYLPPGLELFRILGTFDKLMTQNPLGYYNDKNNPDHIALINELTSFATEFRNGNSKQLEYWLGDGNSRMLIVRGDNSEPVVTLEHLLPLNDQVLKLAEEKGVKVRQANELNGADIIGAIKVKDVYKLAIAIGDMDETLTGKRLELYKTQNQLEQFKDDLSLFIERAHDVNPSFQRSFYIGDGSSRLYIKIDVLNQRNRDKHSLTFELKTNDAELKHRFEELITSIHLQ